MSISAIQSSNSPLGSYSTRKRPRAAEEEQYNRNTGPDSVSFSAAARALAQGASVTEGEEDPMAAWESLVRADGTAPSGTVSLKEQGLDVFGMMLESLFMASLDENEEAQRNIAEGKISGKAGVLEDSAKAAEIKKLMRDVANGKVDISDLPKAMAAGSGKGAGSDKAFAAKGKNAGTVRE